MNNPALYLKEPRKIKLPAGASQTAVGKDFVARTLPPYSAQPTAHASAHVAANIRAPALC